MINKEYKEPLLNFLVLDFCKESETKLCLESIRNNAEFNHKVIYYHNGNEVEYPYSLFKLGLIDHFIQTKVNNGLGVGSRDLFATSFSKYSCYLQNDQIIGRKFSEKELNDLISIIGIKTCMSISLAGSVCGKNIFSERCHIIETNFYKWMEYNLPLSYGGAGPYHNIQWREGQIQEFYKKNNYIHYTDWPVLVIDNGRSAERQNPDGSRWKHFPDTKQLWLIKGPIKEKYVYPKFSDQEWLNVLKTQTWENGKIPENEIKDSFHVWN